MPLALGALVSNRVFAVPFGEPRRRAEIAEAAVEAVAVLHVQGVDAFGSIDLADTLEVCGDKPAIRDLTHAQIACHRRADSNTVTLVADIPLRGATREPVDCARTIASHGVAELPPNHLDLEARVLKTTLTIPRGALTQSV